MNELQNGRRHRRRNDYFDERGQSIVIIAAVMIALIAFVGIAVDVGFVYARSSQLAAAVDAAALAGATEVRTSNAPCLDVVDADIKAIQFLQTNEMPTSVYSDSLSTCARTTIIGATEYTVTATWPVELFFLRLLGFNTLDVQQSATAAYFPLVDIYASRRVEDGALSTSNQAVFGPQICVNFGDPFSPFLDPQNFRGTHRGDPNDRTYHYRIVVPPDYPSNILRVELFDPDSMNGLLNNISSPNDTHTAEIQHSQTAINLGMPPVDTGSCRCDQGSGQTPPNCTVRDINPCIIDTGELGLDDLDRINPYWFIRVDENRGNGDPALHGDLTCGNPANYDARFNTVTLYELFIFVATPDGVIERLDLASYSGQAGEYTGNPADPRDYDNFSHGTDLHWTSPGGTPIFDQPAVVPANCGSLNGGYSLPGDDTSATPRCPITPQFPYSPPGPGRGFEIDLDNFPNIVTDQSTGSRYLYIDVTTLSGASENGFEIWAGPPDYVNSISSNVNARNIQIVNSPGSHSAQGATVFGIGNLPMNSNSENPVEIPLIFVGPEYAGATIEISLYDTDAQAEPPVVFFFDTIAYDGDGMVGAWPGDNGNTDFAAPFAVSGQPDADGVPYGVRCDPGSCGTQWVDPAYQIQVPTFDAAACAADPANQLVCTPFYGGRLMARYIGGLNDTYGWEIRLPGLPFLTE